MCIKLKLRESTHKHLLPIIIRYRVILVSTITILNSGCASTGTQNIYFLGLVKHAKPKLQTHEGNMNYLGYSLDYTSGK
jgi:hypothetical protein